MESGDYLAIGSAVMPAVPNYTALRPSVVHGKIQAPLTRPASLKPVVIGGVLVDPMLKGVEKLFGKQHYLDEDILDAAVNDVFASLGNKSTPPIVHSYEEAIVGVDGDPYKRSLNRTTSPGYPYNLNNKGKGKSTWLGKDENFDLTNVELRTDTENLINLAKKGIRGDAIFMATLKDEKRPHEKVDAGKTRVFEACPQHLAIALRQYFLDFAAHVMEHRIENGIAVGINPYSLEWTKLAHRLQHFGDQLVAGDFSNFDGSLLMQVLMKILFAINEWYGGTEEESLIRAALWEHICNADVLIQGHVIRQTHSQPSGNPLTVIINSLFNLIIMRVAYLLLKKERGLPLVCDYSEYVKDVAYGDDDCKNIALAIISWFNQQTITRILRTIGLTYTDESKGEAEKPYKKLSEITFLKRYFVQSEDGTYMAPMEVSNILEITNWIKGGAAKLATRENCLQALMELGLHDKSTYDYWSKIISRECSSAGVNLRRPTYFEAREEFLANRDIYASARFSPLW